MNYIIHDIDSDGLVGAFVISQYINELKFNDPERAYITYIPFDRGRYEDMIRELYEKLDVYDHVYFVDCCVDEKTADRISDKCPLLIIDHHKHTEWLKTKSYGVWSQGASACLLALENLRLTNNLPLAKLARYVSDRDIWEFKLNNSREISAYLQNVISEIHPEYFMREMQRICDTLYKDYNYCYMCGEIFLRATNITCKKFSWETPIYYKGIPIFNRSYLISESLHWYLNSKRNTNDIPIAGCYYVKDSNFLVFSFRSIDKESFNSKDDFSTAYEVARSLGGGGHLHAAGATLSLEDGLKLLLEASRVSGT